MGISKSPWQKFGRNCLIYLISAYCQSRDLLFIRSCACTDELLEVEALAALKVDHLAETESFPVSWQLKPPFLTWKDLYAALCESFGRASGRFALLLQMAETLNVSCRLSRSAVQHKTYQSWLMCLRILLLAEIFRHPSPLKAETGWCTQLDLQGSCWPWWLMGRRFARTYAIHHDHILEFLLSSEGATGRAYPSCFLARHHTEKWK